MSNTHVKTSDGVEFDTVDRGNGHQGGKWAAAIGSAIVGGAVGYQWGRNNGESNGRDNRGGRGGDGCGDNHGCGSDAVVNRFELEQSERMSEKDARIAKLEARIESEGYTNNAILALRQELVAANNKQDEIALESAKAIAKLEVKEAISGERLACLRDTIGEIKGSVAEVSKGALRAIKESRKATQEWVAAGFVAQPRAKICGTFELECASSEE
ncbi:MAG: hypothetical protein R3Y68_09450 [Rikenellaceae bacterium]